MRAPAVASGATAGAAANVEHGVFAERGDRARGGRLPAYAAVAMVGIAVGLGLFTFVYAEGGSYLSNDPQACVNCHVMRDEFDSWNRSSHHAAAVCNDCHTPHGMPDKYVIKGINGFNHSLAFTTGRFPDPIRIKAMNARVAHQACLSCHQGMVGAVHEPGEGDDRACTACHGNVGHSR